MILSPIVWIIPVDTSV